MGWNGGIPPARRRCPQGSPIAPLSCSASPSPTSVSRARDLWTQRTADGCSVDAARAPPASAPRRSCGRPVARASSSSLDEQLVGPQRSPASAGRAIVSSIRPRSICAALLMRLTALGPPLEDRGSRFPSAAIKVGIWPHNRKRPAGEGGRFWGYYREERTGGGERPSQIWLYDGGRVRLAPVVSDWEGARLAHQWRTDRATRCLLPASLR
jgi:hypothetical protein